MSQIDPFNDDELRSLGLDESYLPATAPGGRLEAPKPVPRASMPKVVGGGVLGVVAVLMVLQMVLRVATGNFHSTGLGYLIGTLLIIGLPAWGSRRLLTSHNRELKAWEEQRRLEQKRHGYGI